MDHRFPSPITRPPSPGLAALAAAIVLATGAFPGRAVAEEAKDPKLPDLGKVKQEEAREKLARLEEAMDRLSRLLAPSEPHNAAKLKAAFQASRERLLREGMDRILEYLESRKLDRAIERQSEAKVRLEEILAILLEKDIDPRELLKHIRRLRDLVQDLDKVVADEARHQSSADAAEAGGATDATESDLAKLEDLIRREKEIEARAKDPESAPEADLRKLAPAQEKLRQETADLARRDAERAEPGAAKEGKAGSPRPGSVLDARALERAQASMNEAAGALAAGDRAGARAKAGAARKALEEAAGTGRERLERLERPRDLKKLEAGQEKTKEEADAIARRMEEPPPLVPSPEGDVPGRSDVNGAAGDMAEAMRELAGGKAGRAARKQAEAVEKLKAGREKTEETLAELQRALRERILAYLIEKFTRMLEEQRAVSRETRSLDLKLRALAAARAAGSAAEPERKDRQLAEALAGREAGVNALADDVLDLLAEDGTTLVFPELVQAVKRDVTRAGALLSRMEAGELTQRIQKEIEAAIEEILKALEIARRSPPPPDPSRGQGSKSGAGPLLPLSAELKLVRALQARVNERTRAFDSVRRPELGPEDEAEIEAIRRNQKEAERMLRKLRDAAGER